MGIEHFEERPQRGENDMPSEIPLEYSGLAKKYNTVHISTVTRKELCHKTVPENLSSYPVRQIFSAEVTKSIE